MATASYVFVTGAISLAEVVKCLETEDSRAEDCVEIEDDSLKAVWTVLYMEREKKQPTSVLFRKSRYFYFSGLKLPYTQHFAVVGTGD